MNKIGIVGQIAMAFILPGIGAALMNGLGGAAASMVANTFGGITGAIVKGAGHVLNAAHKFVTVGKNVFNTVSQGVSKFVGEFGKTALNKIPGVNIESASKNFFGTGGAWETVQKDIVKNASKIMDPFKSTAKIAEGMGVSDVTTYTSEQAEKLAALTGEPLDYVEFKLDQQGLLASSTSSGLTQAEGLAALTGEPIDYVDFKLKQQQDKQVDFLQTMSGEDRDYIQFKVDQQQTSSMLSPPVGSSITPPPVPDSSQTFTQSILQSAKDELAERYTFGTTPIAGTLKAIGDAQAVEAQFSDPVYDDGFGYNAPMYVASSAQDFDVRAPSAPRNFNAYSGGGQFGSTARVYDTILMSPVSTWSRDLSSRYA